MSSEQQRQSAATEGQPLNGLLLIQADLRYAGLVALSHVAIHVIYHNEVFLLKACDAQEAAAWLGSDAQRLVQWSPSGMRDDLSGIWSKPTLEIPGWVKDWPTTRDVTKLPLEEGAQAQAQSQEEQ